MFELTISIPYPPEWLVGFILIWFMFGLMITLAHSIKADAKSGGMFIRKFSNSDLLWIIPLSAMAFPFMIWKWRKM